MDTPFETVDLRCSCGASLRQVDFAHRTAEAEGEFRAQHVGEFHVVSGAGPEAVRCPVPRDDEQAVEWYGQGSAALDWYRKVVRVAEEQTPGEVWVMPARGQKS